MANTYFAHGKLVTYIADIETFMTFLVHEDPRNNDIMPVPLL